MVPKAVASGCSAGRASTQNGRMEAQTAALVMGAGGLAVSAHVLWRAGARQRRQHGWPWWVATLAVSTLVWPLCIWAALRPSTAGNILAAAWLLGWPMAWLAGWRRFHARQQLPGQGWLDGSAWALATLASPWWPWQAVVLLHVYVTAVLCVGRARTADHGLGWTAVAVAAAALPAMFALLEAASAPLDRLLPWWAGLAALWACSLLALASMAERTEQELRASRRRLQVLAGTDPLTGVSNRRHFEAATARRRLRQEATPPVLLLLDIDHFKQINDHLGHATGDRALRLVGHSIQGALRDSDLAVRLGGDEFALLLQGASLPQAMQVAERVVLQVQRLAASHRLPVLSLSFGLVPWRPDEALDEALHRADRALYEAKRQGRSRAVAAHGDDAAPAFSESQRLGLDSP